MLAMKPDSSGRPTRLTLAYTSVMHGYAVVCTPLNAP